MRVVTFALLFFPIIVFLLNGCTSPAEDGLPGKVSNTSANSTYHPAGWKDNPRHGIDYSRNPQNCKACHGSDLQGGPSGVSCGGCHHRGWTGTHAEAFKEDPTSCQPCHGDASGKWCADCHHRGWTGIHGEEYAADPDNCKVCHGEDLNGKGDQKRDCGFCHHEEAAGQWQHGDYHTLPDRDCANCHGADFTGANSLVSCFSCHSGIRAFDCADCHTGPAASYTDSAHGNTSEGVKYSDPEDPEKDYMKGDCTNCHDLPSGSTKDLLLFAAVNPTSQTDNFCFQCHTSTDPVQAGITNKDYSGTFGGASEGVTSIYDAFNQLSSHKLNDVYEFITGTGDQTDSGKGFDDFAAGSNPCSGCHNVHLAKRNKENQGDPTDTAISLPSDHDNLYGDDPYIDPDSPGERMSRYNFDDGALTYQYQAPYSGDGVYEPDGSDTEPAGGWGSNTPDYVTFCTDCHNSSNEINSTALGRPLKTIDWDFEKHGSGVADDCAPRLVLPYVEAQCGGYVLSCTDCHEPHGSPNNFLIRRRVNNGEVTVIQNGTGAGPQGRVSREWAYLCGKCHSGLLTGDGHAHPTTLPPDPEGTCSQSNCHGMHAGPMYRACGECHYHGNSIIEGTTYNEPLF